MGYAAHRGTSCMKTCNLLWYMVPFNHKKLASIGGKIYTRESPHSQFHILSFFLRCNSSWYSMRHCLQCQLVGGRAVQKEYTYMHGGNLWVPIQHKEIQTTVEPRLTDTPEMRTSTIMWKVCVVLNVFYVYFVQSKPLKSRHPYIP